MCGGEGCDWHRAKTSPRSGNLMHAAGTPRLSEADFQRRIIDYAHLRGWLVHHCRPVRMPSGHYATPIQGDAGFLDLVLARRGVVWFYEVKRDTGQTTDLQDAWIGAVGIRARVVRPKDWAQILEDLK